LEIFEESQPSNSINTEEF